MKTFVRVCLAQINTTVGDLKGNRDRAAEAIRQAKKKGVQIVVFPELTLTGYPPEDLLFKKNFVDENLRMLRSLASVSSGTLTVIGFVDRDASGRLYNAAAVLSNGRRTAVYRKVELPNYGVFDEKRYFFSGKKGLVLQWGHVRIGISICEDIWQAGSFVHQAPYKRGLSLHVNLSASPFHRNKQNLRESLLKRLAKKNQSPVLYNNLVGGQDELVFDGGSSIVSAKGRLLGRAAMFREDLLVLDVPVRLFSDKLPGGVHSDVIYLKNKIKYRKSLKGLFIGKPVKKHSSLAEVYEALVLGTRDYLQKNRFSKALIGLSGGVDSAIVACIAVDALGAENVVGVTMPSRYTSPETLKDAHELSNNLGILCHELPIEKPHEVYLRLLAPVFEGLPADSTEENLQARIRGTLLMALSNKLGHLVLATGNKSELATGYCTLYGDMAGGFAVIKDVPKTLVYALARYRNGLYAKKAIPPSTLQRAPSAELRPNQKDQDTLPPYPVLDKILESYVENDRSEQYLLQSGFEPSLVRGLLRRVDQNEYKRRQAPIGIKITPKAFGRDRRLPVTNRFLQ